MRRRTIATLALGASACAALSTAAWAGGTQTVVDVGRSLVSVPSAAADELPPFDDCEQLREWYVREALPLVGPWGFDGPPVMYARAQEDALATPTPVGSSASGTNVQESDVDESDIAKTDGRIVVRVLGRRLVVTDVSGARPREVSRVTLPGPVLARPELLLRDGRVVVVGGERMLPYVGGPVVNDLPRKRSLLPQPPMSMRTRIVSVDVSDPSSPRVSASRTVEGGAVSTREYADGVARVVVDTRHPDLDLVAPGPGRTARQALLENRRIVRDAPVDAWLPFITSTVSGEREALGCSDVRHPEHPAGLGTLTVLTLDADDDLSATAVTASGQLVYSSASRLYVGTTGTASTTVHAFALDGGSTSYVGSGSVPGTVKDRWSFSEYDGHLRVAIARGGEWQPRDNAVVVLAERDGRLVQTGRVDGLGKGEQLKSVRWLGDVAVVVTFRQTDPLYTLDLSDPARPRLTGELKIPGYSAYLHPVGGDLLVGVGHDATTSGVDLGTQIATFDLSDLSHVRRVDTVGLGHASAPGVESDPRTFSYLPAQRTLVTTVLDWRSAVSRFVAMHVATDGTLTRTGSWQSAGYGTLDLRALPLGGDRVALVDDDVRVVRVG